MLTTLVLATRRMVFVSQRLVVAVLIGWSTLGAAPSNTPEPPATTHDADKATHVVKSDDAHIDNSAQADAAKEKTAPENMQQAKKTASATPAQPNWSGGESDSLVQVANLIYAGTKSSRCFADHFLIRAERESTISTSRRFHAVKLASPDVFEFPMVIMTGEGDFTLTEAERTNLRDYLERGGFLLASAGCSSREWDRAFRREIKAVMPDNELAAIPEDHAIFDMVYEIKELQAKCRAAHPLEGVTYSSRLAVLYSQDGLNDTANTTGCCCCGGNEIHNAEQINVNILAYALTH